MAMVYAISFILAFIFVAVVGFGLLNISSTGILTAMTFIFSGVFYVLLEVLSAPRRERAEKKDKEKLVQISKYAEFKPDSSGHSGTLILKKQAEILSSVIYIEKVNNIEVAYVPETLVYTGATVGGVTTGGFHTQGNYNKISGMSNSGKAELRWCGMRDEEGNAVSAKISYIKLNGTLLDKAKKDPTMKKFIKDDGTLYLRHDDKDIGLSSLISPTDIGTANFYNLANKNAVATGLTESECKSIKEWICTDDSKK